MKAGKTKHNPKIEQLDQFIYVSPTSKLQKQHNKDVLQLVETIKAKRIVEAASGQHGFQDSTKAKQAFIGFSMTS